ncbi:DUF4832 domain-containing protein [Balneolales bacterium ANBcel1]|nr:DUF4832 domain-containing protein [Balneolales bacterium ANBcel1]
MKNLASRIIATSLMIGALLAFTQLENQMTLEENTVFYDESMDNLPNPERGFYSFTEGIPGRAPARAETFTELRNNGQSLISRFYMLDNFRDSDLSPEFLEQMDGDFEAMRDAGVKSIIRFRYTRSMDVPDAPLDRILSHLDQLQPVFERNADVIAVAHAGFIGAWGEWHASHHNLDNTSARREVLFKFLEVMPEERAVQIRYPNFKRQIFDRVEPLSEEEAFDGSFFSRTAHHNDCFLASPTDVGTYHGLDAEAVKEYLSLENRYLPMGGETCRLRDDAGTRFHCDSAISEMEWIRWSFLNRNYYAGILDHWRDNGCMEEIERRLGYRFVMREGTYTDVAAPNTSFRFNLEIENVGFAAPFNPRHVRIVLRNAFDANDFWVVELPDDPRFWQGGETVSLEYKIGIPETMNDGIYEAFLYMPDPAENLANDPRFAIRMANERTWNSDTGFNSLNHVLVIDSSADGELHDGDLVFSSSALAFPTSSEMQPVEKPTGPRLHQNYPNPFNPTTAIGFDLPEAGEISLVVYDVIGRRVAILAEGSYPAGRHNVSFNASRLGSGHYLYRLQVGDHIETRQMMLIN